MHRLKSSPSDTALPRCVFEEEAYAVAVGCDQRRASAKPR